MDIIETPSKCHPTLLFKRYIDDYLIITDDRDTLDAIFRSLTSQDRHIKLTRETPNNGWLPFLNCEIRQKGGIFETKWYKKPSNRNIMIKVESHHPIKQKTNIIKVMEKTASNMSSWQHRKEAVSKTRSIIQKNGYTKEWIRKTKQKNRDKQPNYKQTENQTTLAVPFISDETSNIIRKSLKDMGVTARVVELKGKCLRDILVKNRGFENICERRNCRVYPQTKIGSCNIKGAIYRLKCGCGEIYIGETGRPLAERINEHFRAAEKPLTQSYLNTTWSKHAKSHHNSDSLSLTLDIITTERNTTRRKALEATYIKDLDPKLNTKEEINELVNIFGTLQKT
uniref:GIY-YIG domain-containing protein n=1 Tax=Caenorhabditis tropicalis TaxID=1561998 RepID=A0A1I7T7V9_9PELO